MTWQLWRRRPARPCGFAGNLSALVRREFSSSRTPAFRLVPRRRSEGPRAVRTPDTSHLLPPTRFFVSAIDMRAALRATTTRLDAGDVPVGGRIVARAVVDLVGRRLRLMTGTGA